MSQIRELIISLDWWEFYDICEELLRITEAPDKVAEEIDFIFSWEGLPYTITSSGISWRMSPPAQKLITEASSLLSESEFVGPSQQWQKALEHLSRRPPDSENCIKDAVGALEGIGRILSGKPKDTLGQIMKPLAVELKIHRSLANAISNVYGYRGDEEAIGLNSSYIGVRR